MSQVLQVLEIIGILTYHIFEFFWPRKVTSTHRKRKTECCGGRKVYVEMIDNFYLILHDRRR